MAAQRRRFSRAVAPLDEELDQFIAFQRHLSAAVQPTTLLAEHGLFLGDWVRLQERWAERLAAHVDARARAAEVMSSEKLPPMPAVALRPRALPPPLNPRSAAPSLVVTAQAEDVDCVEWGLGVLRGGASPAAIPAAAGDQLLSNRIAAPAAALPPLPAKPEEQVPLSPLHSAWNEGLVWESFPIHPERQALSASEDAVAPDAASVTLPPSATGLDWLASAVHPLPFHQHLPRLDVEPEVLARLPETSKNLAIEETLPPPPVASIDPLPFQGAQDGSTHSYVGEDLAVRTLPPVTFVLQTPLPFVATEEQDADELLEVTMYTDIASDAHFGVADGDREDAAVTTLPPGLYLVGPSLPFRDVIAQRERTPLVMRESGPSPPPSSGGAEVGHRQDLTATMPLTLGPLFHRAVLPFQVKEAQEDDDEAGVTQVFAPSVTSTRDAAVDADEDSDAPTLPPPPERQARGKMHEPAQDRHAQGTSMRSEGQAAGGAPREADTPQLSLEAHASLCAKLALAPADAEQIFARYGLASPETRRAVDEAWKERLRREPKLYEEWQRLYSMFYARWSQQRPR
jgi:hypothetical protein